MPRPRTTSQASVVLAAVARTAVVTALAVLLTGPVGLASAQAGGAGLRGAAGAPSRSAEVTSEPTAAPRGPEEVTPAGPPAPARLDGAVTPRRYGLPTALAVVLLLGVVSLQLRLLLAEPAGRRAEPAARGPAPARGQGVGSPRW